MTCIVGLVTEEGAYVGGDSRITQDTSILPGVFEKIFFKNKILLGFCGNYRFGQILKYRFDIPELKKMDFEEYLNTDFMDYFTDCLEDSNYTYKSDGASRIEGDSGLLIAYGNEIFTIDPDFCVTKVTKIDALGTGSCYAVGSLETTEGDDLPPEDRIKISLDVACKYDSACSPPFTILCTNGERYL